MGVFLYCFPLFHHLCIQFNVGKPSLLVIKASNCIFCGQNCMEVVAWQAGLTYVMVCDTDNTASSVILNFLHGF